MLDAPAASRPKKVRTRVLSPQVRRSDPTFPARLVLTVSFVLSPVIGLFVTVAREIDFASLMPASRHQDHTTSPSAVALLVRQRHRVHRIPAPNVRDDRETPLLIGHGTREEQPLICPTAQAKKCASQA